MNGEVREWLKRAASKAAIPQKGIGGSNPSLSAIIRGSFAGLRISPAGSRSAHARIRLKLKRATSKAAIPQKGIGGSNPSLSAITRTSFERDPSLPLGFSPADVTPRAQEPWRSVRSRATALARPA
jgi:hypothetical protein